MEDNNQWCLYDHDPLLLTDVSLQQESSSYTHCSSCKNPSTFLILIFSLSLSCGNSKFLFFKKLIITSKFWIWWYPRAPFCLVCHFLFSFWRDSSFTSITELSEFGYGGQACVSRWQPQHWLGHWTEEKMKNFVKELNLFLVLDEPPFCDFDEGCELMLQGFLRKMEDLKGTAWNSMTQMWKMCLMVNGIRFC